MKVTTAKLADGVHKAVCLLTKSDGYSDCLLYAMLSCAWLNKHGGGNFGMAGGKVSVSLEGQDKPAIFDHFWVMSKMVNNKWLYVDFATRHIGRTITNGLSKLGVEAKIPDSFQMPFLYGYNHNLPWSYLITNDDTMHAQTEYSIVDNDRLIKLVDKQLKRR